MVGATGFEPATSWSRTKRSTRLSHAPCLVRLWAVKLGGTIVGSRRGASKFARGLGLADDEQVGGGVFGGGGLQGEGVDDGGEQAGGAALENHGGLAGGFDAEVAFDGE